MSMMRVTKHHPLLITIWQKIQINDSNVNSNVSTNGGDNNGNASNGCETYVLSTLTPEP